MVIARQALPSPSQSPPSSSFSTAITSGAMEGLRQRFSLTDKELYKMIRMSPEMKDERSMRFAQTNVDFVVRRLSLSHDEVRKMMIKVPEMITYSIDNNLEPKLSYLVDRLSLNHDDLRKMILTVPSLLSMDIEEDLKPKIAYLEDRLGLNPRSDKLRKLVVTMPTLLNYTTFDIHPKLACLENQLHLNADGLRYLIIGMPQLLSYDINGKLVSLIQYLENRLSMHPTDVRQLLTTNPAFMNTDIDKNLSPTIDFVEDLLGRDQGRPLIARNLKTINWGLASRLPQRKERMIEAGKQFNDESVLIMCMKSDDQFDRWLTGKAERKKAHDSMFKEKRREARKHLQR
jgi:hypothetical protein